MAHKSDENSSFEVLDVLFWDKYFFCSLNVLYGGLDQKSWVWIRIRNDKKCWIRIRIRIRIKTNADPQQGKSR
jgi:hypothetical protein